MIVYCNRHCSLSIVHCSFRTDRISEEQSYTMYMLSSFLCAFFLFPTPLVATPSPKH
jgi:hypothetical protein